MKIWKTIKDLFVKVVVGLPIYVFEAFWVDAIMFEIENGVSFDWKLLFDNKSFHLTLIIHTGIIFYKNYRKHRKNEDIEEAIKNGQIKVVEEVTVRIKKDDFDSVDKLIGIYDELEKRRNDA